MTRRRNLLTTQPLSYRDGAIENMYPIYHIIGSAPSLLLPRGNIHGTDYLRPFVNYWRQALRRYPKGVSNVSRKCFRAYANARFSMERARQRCRRTSRRFFVARPCIIRFRSFLQQQRKGRYPPLLLPAYSNLYGQHEFQFLEYLGGTCIMMYYSLREICLQNCILLVKDSNSLG